MRNLPVDKICVRRIVVRRNQGRPRQVYLLDRIVWFERFEGIIPDAGKPKYRFMDGKQERPTIVKDTLPVKLISQSTATKIGGL